MTTLRLDGIASWRFSEYLRRARPGVHRIAVATSGYEGRSSFWTKTVIQSGALDLFANVSVVGFRGNPSKPARLENDSFYITSGLPPQTLESDSGEDFIKWFKRKLESERVLASGKTIEVHVDYSCMPRSWYCELPSLLARSLTRNDTAFLWYTKGVYTQSEYPTAGVDDFRIFSGRPTLSPTHRTHVFGLGFDMIRSHAIWSVLEPKRWVCFYAERGADSAYIQRVQTDNADLMAAGVFTFTVPVDDFVSAFSRIRATVLDLRLEGDVVLVPDGPKQLILASSIIPLTSSAPGVVCLHVRRRKDPDIGVLDVPGTGDPCGFCMYGES